MKNILANWHSISGILFVILASTLWAIDTLIRYPMIMGGMSATSLVFYEHLFLTVITGIILSKSLKNFPTFAWSHFLGFFVVGGIGSALSTIAFTKAFSLLNPSLVILMQKLQPVVAIIMARFVLNEKMGKEFIFWAIICLAGGTLISYEDIKNINFEYDNIFGNSDALLGYFLVLFSVFGWGSATVFGKKLGLQGYNDEEIMAGRFLMGLGCMIPLVIIQKSELSFPLETYGKISLMVLVSGLLAMYVFYQGLRRIDARTCSLTEMFFPFMAVIINWLFLDAKLSAVQLLGGGILLFGSISMQLRTQTTLPQQS